MLARKFDRGGARHLIHRGLGGAVGDVGEAEMADRGDRRDIDDRAAALLHHHGNDVFHGEVRTLEIDGKDVVPARFAHIDDASHLCDAYIVVEHIDAAIGLQARRHHRLDVGGARDVRGERGCFAALACDDLHGLFRSSRVAIDAKHLRALARKGRGGRLAVAPARPDRACADNKRDFSLEPIHRRLPVCLVAFYGSQALMTVTLAPIGRSKISDSVRQWPSAHIRHSPAAPELPSTSCGTAARLGCH